MSRIDKLHIHNFKFFDEKKPIELGGRHLLLFGENGSGKSSVYWALYTLFEASVKYDDEEIKKYFQHPEDHNQSLINIYADKITEADNTEHYNSYIKVTRMDGLPDFEVSLLNTAISGNVDAVEVNQASDFINYKVLYKFQDFWNGEPMDLANIFEGYILPYINFPAKNILRDGVLEPRTSATDMLHELNIGPGTRLNVKNNTIQVYKSSEEYKVFLQFVKHFNDNLQELIDFINANAPEMLKKLGYDIEFVLKFKEFKFRKGDSRYYPEKFKVEFIITSYLGKKVNIHRPQSFLNEAKITAIAIAIRLTILRRRINEQAPDVLKFIVFDDVMISLDMNNRDKLINFILDEENKFKDDYQLLFLTHDKNLFDFISNKIKQYDKVENWVFKEMYSGKDEITLKEYPIIIDSHLEFSDKAKKYFEAKDYTTCSLYLRKELEKLVNERLPYELKYKTDGSFLSLQTLWGNMVERYSTLNKPILEEIKENFSQTKLMILNPQAHFQNISLPIYKTELESAFKLIDDLKNHCPIPKQTILLTKGICLKFTHPQLNYTFEFELLSDFYIDGFEGETSVKYPKCKIIGWQWNGNDFQIPSTNQILNEQQVSDLKLRTDKLNKVIANLKLDAVLKIDENLFGENTLLTNSIWSLKEVIEKAKVSL